MQSNYKSISNLNIDIIKNLHRIPKDVALVVGIPRSGLLVANRIALHLNCALVDLDGFLSDRTFLAGLRMTYGRKFSEKSKILIVDDSVGSGRQIAEVRKRISDFAPKNEVVYLAAYVTQQGASMVDLFFEVVPFPRFFEWNIMHHPEHMLNACIDIDGVLCRDPTDHENDDSSNYVEFLKTVEPLVLPTCPVGYLVTCRLEKFRAETEQWMKRHGVLYKKLFMMQYSTKAERQAANRYGEYKAEIFNSLDSPLFVESNVSQARDIAKISGKQVLCFSTGELFSGFQLSNKTERNPIKTEPQFVGSSISENTTAKKRLLISGLIGFKMKLISRAKSVIKKMIKLLVNAGSLQNTPVGKNNVWMKIIGYLTTQINLKRKKKFQNRMLEIGPGAQRIPGFETLNFLYAPHVDYVWDATKKLPFNSNSFSLIYASHILEHSPWYHVESVLKEWVRVLKPGGVIELWVPDGLKICDAFVKSENEGFNPFLFDPWTRFNDERDPCVWANGRIFTYGDGTGSLNDPNWHRTLFSERFLRKIMLNSGLRNIELMHREEVRGQDHGWINLGMKGQKP